MPQITMTGDEYDTLLQRIATADARAAKLEKERDTALRADPAESSKLAFAAVEAAVPVVQFAVGNLDPTTVRGWPFQALRDFAAAIEKLPVGQATHESVITWRKHADDAEGLERYRAAHKPPVIPAMPGDFGPQTDEARAQHERHGGAFKAPDEEKGS